MYSMPQSASVRRVALQPIAGRYGLQGMRLPSGRCDLYFARGGRDHAAPPSGRSDGSGADGNPPGRDGPNRPGDALVHPIQSREGTEKRGFPPVAESDGVIYGVRPRSEAQLPLFTQGLQSTQAMLGQDIL